MLFQIKQIPSAGTQGSGIVAPGSPERKKKVDYYNKVCDENFKLGDLIFRTKVVIKG